MSDERDNRIIESVSDLGRCTSGEIAARLQTSETVSLATVKRAIASLLTRGLLIREGSGKGTRYGLSAACRLQRPIDIIDYYAKEQDERTIIETFNRELIPAILSENHLFTQREEDHLAGLQNEFIQKTAELTSAAYNRELERLGIDLSWKSSQIEGNTYTLLETERLLREGRGVDGKSKEEATMLLNHKATLDYLINNHGDLEPLTVGAISHIHYKLVVGLDSETDIRATRVGVTGTNYRPLGFLLDIERVLREMCDLINQRQNAFEKALLALALISYIQPFNDGNKRTARMVSNGILLGNGCCPLSFRTVDTLTFKQALLLFYEQNNISCLKQIFITQCEFAVHTYF
jgi:Fic family protein